LLLEGTRNLSDNLSDLKAQVAANLRGAALVEELIQERSYKVVRAYMHFIRQHCDNCVQQLIRTKVQVLIWNCTYKP
jgi:5-oxoprolinase (ATP-hydrolysing)